MADTISLIRQCRQLYDEGRLTDEDFSSAKRRLLENPNASQIIEQLAEACALHAEGSLTDEEFAAMKRQILALPTPETAEEKSPEPRATVREQAPREKEPERREVYREETLKAATEAEVLSAPQEAEQNAMDLRQESARKLIRRCALIAALIGLIPFPFRDSPLLIILQFVMVTLLCRKYGRKMGASLSLIILAGVLGPVVFYAIAKFIPLLGPILGALIAGGLTWMVGHLTHSLLDNDEDFTWANFRHALRRAFAHRS